MAENTSNMAEAAFEIPQCETGQGNSIEDAEVRTLVFHPKKGDASTYLDGLSMCGIKNRDTVQTLKDAIDRLIVQHYDLILVTFLEDSPVSDQFVDELKNLEATASIPLVAVTTDGRPKNVLRIMAKGVDQALVSPFSRNAVREAVNAALWPEQMEGVAGALHVAWRRLEQQQKEEAEAIFEAVAAQEPGNVEARIGLATILLERDEDQAGVALLKEAMKLAKRLSNVVEQYTLLSRIYHCMGEHFERHKAGEQAIKHYKAALKLNPFNLGTLPVLLGIMSASSTVDEILAFLDEMRGDFAPFSKPLDHIADSLEGLIKRYQALNIQENVDKVFHYLARLDHNNGALHLRTVDFLLAAPDGGRAAKELLERITSGVRDTDLMSRLADLYVQAANAQAGDGAAGAGDAGISAFEELSREELLRKAYDWYNESLMLEPFEPSIWMNLVRCHLWLGDAERAQDTLQRFVESIDVTADELAQIGEVLVNEKAYDLAADYIHDGAQQYPEDSRFYLLQGKLHNAQGEHFKAVASLKTGLNENPENIQCMVELAATYGQLQKWNDAIEFYERASQARPDDEEISNALQLALKQKYKK